MKLQLVPARTGLLWVQLGLKTFFRQPLAMAGLFFIFMATVSVLTAIPLVGAVISLALLPAATAGFMAASRTAAAGKFPMPWLLLTAFRSGRVQARAMWVLGAQYAVGMLLVMGTSALFDGGEFARIYLGGANPTPEVVREPAFIRAMWIGMALYVPLAMAFWHAPALVLWHGMSPTKSLFFSAMACWRNKGAMLVYALGWIGVFLGVGVALSLVGAVLGGAQALGMLMFPAVLLMASLFFSSIYFTFRDSFSQEPEAPGDDTPGSDGSFPPDHPTHGEGT